MDLEILACEIRSVTLKRRNVSDMTTLAKADGSKRKWNLRSSLKRAALVGAAAVMGLALTPGTAQAATTSCYVSVGSSSCSSGTISSNASGNYIYYSVRGGLTCAQADFQIIDRGNGAVVYTRHVGSGVASGYRYGLYASYYLRVYNSCGGGGGKIES
jgi:hypothetical protein